jgi:hypothetical protein
MASQQLTCPGCGTAIKWTVPKPGKLRLGCACHSIDFDTSTASADDVAALKIAAEEILREEHAKAMAMMAALAPEAGVRQ